MTVAEFLRRLLTWRRPRCVAHASSRLVDALELEERTLRRQVRERANGSSRPAPPP